MENEVTITPLSKEQQLEFTQRRIGELTEKISFMRTERDRLQDLEWGLLCDVQLARQGVEAPPINVVE